MSPFSGNRHGKDLRYCYPWQKWLVWDGRSWQKDDVGIVVSKAKRTARAIYHEAAECDDEKLRRELAQWAKTSESQF